MTKKTQASNMAMRRMQVVLLVVRSRDELGRPRALEALYDEETIDVSDPKNRHFITALCEPGAVAPKPKARG